MEGGLADGERGSLTPPLGAQRGLKLLASPLPRCACHTDRKSSKKTHAHVEKIVRRELKKVHATHAEAAPAQEASDQPLRM